MKNYNLNSTVRTNCKNCAFAIYNANTQVGCEHDRIQQFRTDSVTKARDDEKEFFVIERFCNYFRDKSWGYDLKDKQKTIEESAVTYSLIIDCNNIVSDKSILNFISNIDYYPNKISIHLFHDKSRFSSVKEYVANIARNCGKNVNISVLSDSKNILLHNQIMNSKSFFHCVLCKTEDKNFSFAKDIEAFINRHLKRGFVIDHMGNIFINNHIYKAIAHINQLFTYEETLSKLIEDSKKLNMYFTIYNEN